MSRPCKVDSKLKPQGIRASLSVDLYNKLPSLAIGLLLYASVYIQLFEWTPRRRCASNDVRRWAPVNDFELNGLRLYAKRAMLAGIASWSPGEVCFNYFIFSFFFWLAIICKCSQLFCGGFYIKWYYVLLSIGIIIKLFNQYLFGINLNNFWFQPWFLFGNTISLIYGFTLDRHRFSINPWFSYRSSKIFEAVVFNWTVELAKLMQQNFQTVRFEFIDWRPTLAGVGRASEAWSLRYRKQKMFALTYIYIYI